MCLGRKSKSLARNSIERKECFGWKSTQSYALIVSHRKANAIVTVERYVRLMSSRCGRIALNSTQIYLFYEFHFLWLLAPLNKGSSTGGSTAKRKTTFEKINTNNNEQYTKIHGRSMTFSCEACAF